MNKNKANYSDVWYQSSDGLKLYARDYNCTDEGAPVVLCMHGLTRNSADFEDIADILADSYRLIVVDQRGRGLSDYDSQYENYTPLVYMQDMFTLLEHLRLSSVILFGTSLGGLISMMMASSNIKMFKGIILNDICPEISVEGINRIRGYVGGNMLAQNWEEAADSCKRINGVAFPEASDEEWLAFARRVFKEQEDGHLRLAYDENIAIPFASDEALEPVNLWPLFEQIKSLPILSIRGELSDILTADSVAKMQSIKHDLDICTVDCVGHAPLLNEPQATRSVLAFLKKVSQNP